MSPHGIAPEKEHPLPALINRMFIIWGCSFLWGGGVFFSILAIAGAMIAGLLSFFEPPVWEMSGMIILISGLSVAFSSPILLGASVTHNWQRGIKIGISSFLAGILSFLVVWTSGSIFSEWAHHNWFNYFDNSFRLLRIIDSVLPILTISVTACCTIVILIVLTQIHQNRNFELTAGAVVGIGLSMVSGMLLRKDLLANNNVLHLIWQIPPLVWISTIYILELLAGRSKWADSLIWFLLVLISFGLPFIVVPLYPLR
ncbi:MAG: hypothetical protein ACOYYJ_14140 [Chloroflexota bacterium]